MNGINDRSGYRAVVACHAASPSIDRRETRTPDRGGDARRRVAPGKLRGRTHRIGHAASLRSGGNARGGGRHRHGSGRRARAPLPGEPGRRGDPRRHRRGRRARALPGRRAERSRIAHADRASGRPRGMWRRTSAPGRQRVPRRVALVGGRPVRPGATDAGRSDDGSVGRGPALDGARRIDGPVDARSIHERGEGSAESAGRTGPRRRLDGRRRGRGRQHPRQRRE